MESSRFHVRSAAAMISRTPFSVVILAAGKGTRMSSDLHKVLHPIAGRPMLAASARQRRRAGAERSVVVVGTGREQLEAALDGRGVDDRGAGAAARHRPRRPAGRRARSPASTATC